MAPRDIGSEEFEVASASEGRRMAPVPVHETDAVLRILKGGRALIDAPEKWEPFLFGRRADGSSVPMVNKDLADESTVSRCSCAAVRSMVHRLGATIFDHMKAMDLLNAEALRIRPQELGIITLNGATDHATVMLAWDRAISARLRELEG